MICEVIGGRPTAIPEESGHSESHTSLTGSGQK